MKIIAISLAALAASYAALTLPVLSQRHSVATTLAREQVSHHDAARERVDRALEAFRRGDPAAESEAKEVMRMLPAHDERRLAFATVLLARGQTKAAYDLARANAHFAPFSLPDDQSMETYAQIAEGAGHPEEAAWARERIGEDGHFRVWVESQRYAFAKGRMGYGGGPSVYNHSVSYGMDRGLELYPAHRAEIEALRRQLLSKPERP